MSIQQAAVELTQPLTYASPSQVHELMARVRKEQPVCYVEPEGYDPVWIVTRAEDIRYVESNPELFLAGPRSTIGPRYEEDQAEAVGELATLVQMDGDTHRKHRLITQAWFMPKQLKSIEGFVAECAKNFVDLMESKAPACDFAADIAYWYPMRVIMTLFGVPEKDDKLILNLSQQLLGYADEDIEGNSEMEVIMKFYEFFAPIIEQCRANPDDTLASVIANAEVDGELIGVEAVLGYYLVICTAGHDTTSYSTAGGLHALIQHPEQLQMLKDSPDLIPSAVDEMIRWVSPVKHFGRTAAEDVEVGGQKIAKGESLMLLFESGARDENAMENPEIFDITRNNSRNMAFGFGAHSCLGRYLAKMEMEAFFRELLPRLKHIELDGDPTYMASNMVTGAKTLPVRFEFN
jgi:cytochrome P450